MLHSSTTQQQNTINNNKKEERKLKWAHKYQGKQTFKNTSGGKQGHFE
jgi:hypothetical protein